MVERNREADRRTDLGDERGLRSRSRQRSVPLARRRRRRSASEILRTILRQQLVDPVQDASRRDDRLVHSRRGSDQLRGSVLSGTRQGRSPERTRNDPGCACDCRNRRGTWTPVRPIGVDATAGRAERHRDQRSRNATSR